MEYPVINQQGATVRTIELDEAVFGVPMNPTLLHQALVIYQGNKRQGTSDTKTRAQVSGGGRKPWIQKHTGRARQGSIRSPQWRHGGVVFGPHPRDFRRDLPRRMRRQALKCALSERVRLGNLICLDSLDTLGKLEEMWAAPTSHRQRRLAQAEASLVAAGTPQSEGDSGEATAPPEDRRESGEAAAEAPRRRRRTATPEAESTEAESTE